MPAIAGFEIPVSTMETRKLGQGESPVNTAIAIEHLRTVNPDLTTAMDHHNAGSRSIPDNEQP